ncbi:dihydrofolate reductase [Alkalibaculum sp. M08DMB]|uniref:Dihydrofolate reductase n=1 Tax=Alkalibaculum sporogenes TaxID=2655001 RepID=A0A6A7K4D2_9FIRM|nr:dihydrofolate reductase [Alkalibaculum sporogenes]MPW24309.1 dihydrofolate reductase [Alkalibaculum sporogenes]
MYSFVVAVGKNNEMGVNNHLPWHLPNDVKYFKQVTWDHTMIMGRKTFESLLKVLPNRHHIILTRDKSYHIDHNRVSVVYSLDELLSKTPGPQEYTVIGGSQIFDLLLPYTDKIYLTRIDKSFEATVYFNEPDPKDWTIIDEKEGILDENNTIPHKFITLERKVKVCS